MNIKRVYAKKILDSRGQSTIVVFVNSNSGKQWCAAPSGKSKGKYEKKSYSHGGIENDIQYLNSYDFSKTKIEKFKDLKKIETEVGKKIGANSLYALEAALLKCLAKSEKKELWEWLNPDVKKIPLPVGNCIGGGSHSISDKKPDFQEFLFLPETDSFKHAVKINRKAWKLAKVILKEVDDKFKVTVNDENAWETSLQNEQCLNLMEDIREKIYIKERVKLHIGLDVAASTFYEGGKYKYYNPRKFLDKKQQIFYIGNLITKYKILYIEDPLDEEDFAGFKKLLKEAAEHSLIVGDDLTTTNPERLKKAIKNKSINAIIIKPNQIGSLLKMKEAVVLAEKAKLKIIFSHRSGETNDTTIADLAVGFDADFIKTGIWGKGRKEKLKRLMKIEKEIEK